MPPSTRAREPYTGRDAERLLLIPSSHETFAKPKRTPWHQKPHAGCAVLAVLSLFGLGAVLLPSFESPGNITVFRAAEADVRVRQLAGWFEDLNEPGQDSVHAVTLAVTQDRDAILAALASTSDPDSQRYGKHYTQQEVHEISTNKRSLVSVRAFVEKATSGLRVKINWSPGFDFVRLEARVEDLDKIFNAKFRRWERRLRNDVVHETYRTRELAVPKELENHLDGILGALHLPSGQLALASVEAEDADEGEMTTGLDVETRDSGSTASENKVGDRVTAKATVFVSNPAGGDGWDGSDDALRLGDPGRLTPSAYTDREPIEIGKPPVRKQVSEHEWVLREAKALARKAAVGGGGDTGKQSGKNGDGGGAKVANSVPVFKVKVSADADDDLIVAVPTQTVEETEKETGERYLSETPAHKAVSAELVAAGERFARYKRGKDAVEAGDGAGRALLDDTEDVSSEGKGSGVSSSEASSEAASEASSDARETSSDASETSKDPDSSVSKAEKAENAEREAKRVASVKSAEKKRSSRAAAELEDKANAMFQKMDEEMREMKTFMAEVVRRDDDTTETDPDDEEVKDLSGDGAEKGEKGKDDLKEWEDGDEETEDGSTGDARSSASDTIALEKHELKVAVLPVPVVEAGSGAARRAVRRVSDEARRTQQAVDAEDAASASTHTSNESSRETNADPDSVQIPGDFWVPQSDDSNETRPDLDSRDSKGVLPAAPGVDAQSDNDSGTGEAAAANGDGGGYYEYELNYQAEDAEREWASDANSGARVGSGESEESPAVASSSQTGASSGTYRTGAAVRVESPKRGRNSEGLFGETAAARDRRAQKTEERLAALVTPDKVLGYYNVPRTSVVTHPGASVGVAMFSGNTDRTQQSLWKFGEYFNVTVGEIHAVAQVDDFFQNSKEKSDGATATNEALLKTADDVDDSVNDALPVSGDATTGATSAASNQLDQPPLEVSAVGSSKTKAPSKSEKIELAVKSTVASAVSEAVSTAVDVADRFAQGVGLAVEVGEGFPAGTTNDRLVKEALHKTADGGDTGVGGNAKFMRDAGLAVTEKGKVEESESETVDARVSPGHSKSASARVSNARDGGTEGIESNDGGTEGSNSRDGGTEGTEGGTEGTPTTTHAPTTPAEVGWHDVSSSRVEQTLDLQAVISAARGGKVDVLLASPAQHYGWEALDVVFNLAANPDPPSVLSLNFGGMEKPDLNNDFEDFEGTEGHEAGVVVAEKVQSASLGAANESNATVTGGGSAGAGTTTTATTTATASSVSQPPTATASARGLEDGSKPRPSYVKDSNSWDTFERIDTEFAKLGLRGVTVVAASGDNGPFSFGIPNPYIAWSSEQTRTCTFQPSYPASMPHVTAVGGTTGGKDPFEPERASCAELGSKITSGGGFSSTFPVPEWQKLAVTRYLKQYTYDLPPASFFNASNRGYPDLALAADDIALVFTAFDFLGGGDEGIADSDSSEDSEGSAKSTTTDEKEKKGTSNTATASELGATGDEQRTHQKRLDTKSATVSHDALQRRARHYLTESSGTSYSSALFAGMVSLINDERLKRNKTTVGFLNPALYALHKSDGPKVFRDVKEGSSKCPNPKMTGAMVGCCKHGFRTGKGWDPLTGLGSVDFARLRDELAGLP